MRHPNAVHQIGTRPPVCFDTTIGLGSSLSELSFPISSRYALLASWWRLSNEFVMEATVDVTREINKRTIHNAVRHVYASIGDESVAAAIGNSGQRFQLISPAKENFRVMELVRTSPRDGYIKQLVELPLTKDTCRQLG